jgi:hypothetical protein
MSLHTFTGVANTSAIAVWAQGVTNGIAKAGLVRVGGSHALAASGTYAGLASDFTGLAAGAANVAVAWEIWRFADALHPAFPVYIQIWYGSGSVNTYPALWIVAGFEVNAGLTALVGQVFAQQQVHSGGVNAAAQNCFVSGSTNRLLVGLFFDSAYSVILAVERLHAADGSDNDEGVFVFCVGASNTSGQKHQTVMRPTFGGNGELFGTLCGVWPTSNVTVWGSDFHVAPIHPVRGKVLPPSKNIMAAKAADVPNGTPISLSLYGANRQFISAAGPAWQSNFASGASASAFLLRYE